MTWLPIISFAMIIAFIALTFVSGKKSHGSKSHNGKSNDGDTLPDICATLGTFPNFKYKNNGIAAVGKNAFLVPHFKHTFLCVPSKSGNRNWSALMYKLQYGVAPTQEALLNGNYIPERRAPGHLFHADQDQAWLLVRSPYVRLLSVYDKKVFSGTGSRHFHKYHGPPKATFPEFVTGLFEDVLHNNKQQDLDPLARAERLCKLDHHLCVQSSYLFMSRSGQIRILKLENQATWYSDLVNCFKIAPEQVISNDWLNYGPLPCYYTPTDSCDDALTALKITGLKTNVDPIHGGGAAGRVLDKYTPELAAMVTYMYEYDLNVLGYPKWNGTAPFLQPSPYHQ